MIYQFELLEIKSISQEKFNQKSENYITKKIHGFGFLHMNKRSNQIYHIGSSKVIRNNQPDLYKKVLELFNLFGEKQKGIYNHHFSIKQKRMRNSDLHYCKNLIRKNNFTFDELEETK